MEFILLRRGVPHLPGVSTDAACRGRHAYLTLLLALLLSLGSPADLAKADDAPDLLVDDVFPIEQGVDAYGRETDDEPPLEGPWLHEGDEADAERWVRHLRAEPWRVTVLAYAFDRLPGGLEAPTRATSSLLDEAARAAVIAAVRAGSLRLVRTVHAEGRFGDIVRGEDLDEQTLPLLRDIESSIAAVVTFPKAARVHAGLRLRMSLLPAATGGATLRYRISLLARPDVVTKDTIGGELDEVSARAFLAQGTTRIQTGEVQALLDRRADGSGSLLLLAARGPGTRFEPVVDLGNGLVAVLAEHLGAAERRLEARMSDTFQPWLSDQADDESPPYECVWDAFAGAAGAGLGEGVWDEGPLGLWFGIVSPEIRQRLATNLQPGAALRRARVCVQVTSERGDRLRLPACPGTEFAFFQGRMGTEYRDVGVESGCHTCVLAVPRYEHAGRGIAGAGFACVDGTVDLAFEERRVLEEEYRTFPFRRVLPGYEAYDYDSVTLPLRKDRLRRLRCALPKADGRLPGGGRLDYATGADDALVRHVGNTIPDGVIPTGGGGGFLGSVAGPMEAVEPVRLRVNGERFSVRPGDEGTYHDIVRHPFIRRWESEGWCGMRTRCPTLGGLDWPEVGVSEGSTLSIRAYRNRQQMLLVDIAGELHGAPEDLGPFDPGDGVVSIVRSPTLRFSSHALPLGRGQVVAEGAGLVCRVESLVSDTISGAYRDLTFTSSSGLGAARLKTGASSEGHLEAGGVWLLPSATESYVSGHGMGEVTTSFTEIQDGVTLEIEAADLRPTVELRVMSRPALTPYEVRPRVKPPLPLPTLRLLDVGQRDDRRELRLEGSERLDHQSPDPSFPYVLEVRLIRPEPAGASR